MVPSHLDGYFHQERVYGQNRHGAGANGTNNKWMNNLRYRRHGANKRIQMSPSRCGPEAMERDPSLNRFYMFPVPHLIFPDDGDAEQQQPAMRMAIDVRRNINIFMKNCDLLRIIFTIWWQQRLGSIQRDIELMSHYFNLSLVVVDGEEEGTDAESYSLL